MDDLLSIEKTERPAERGFGAPSQIKGSVESPSAAGPRIEDATPDVGPATSRTREIAAPASILAGSMFGLVAAGFYTTSNIALRQSVGVDPFIVTTVKAIPMVLMLAPYVLWMWATNRRIATSLQMLPRFVLASFLAHFVGNSCFQFSLAIIGLAATVPITLGVLIVGGAIFGRILLLEPVKPRTMVSMVFIIAAVVVLSLPGASSSPAQSISQPQSPLWIGALWAIGSGIAYSLFGVITRQTLTGGLSAPATMLVSGLVGVMTLTPFTLLRLGFEPISEVSVEQWSVMFAAGFFNFTAFVALTISLKALPVVAVNLLNASQVAMAAIAAVLLFSEAVTVPLIVGILLTFAGLLVLANRNGARRT